MLREGLTENSYLNSITAHTGYWTNSDYAMYLLLQLYSYKKRQQTVGLMVLLIYRGSLSLCDYAVCVYCTIAVLLLF